MLFLFLDKMFSLFLFSDIDYFYLFLDYIILSF